MSIDPDRIPIGIAPWTVPATIVVALVVGALTGLGPALLVLGAGTLLGVVTLLWSSLGRLTGESPLTLDEAIGLAAPTPNEERKRSILRALKDLEYERSVGKISEEDYAELSTRYREDAKALLRSIAEETAPLRKNAEARLAARLAEAQAPQSKKKRSRKKSEGAPPETDNAPSEAVSASAPGDASTPVCASCATPNDPDARFCKRCGGALPSGAEKR